MQRWRRFHCLGNVLLSCLLSNIFTLLLYSIYSRFLWIEYWSPVVTISVKHFSQTILVESRVSLEINNLLLCFWSIFYFKYLLLHADYKPHFHRFHKNNFFLALMLVLCRLHITQKSVLISIRVGWLTLDSFFPSGLMRMC